MDNLGVGIIGYGVVGKAIAEFYRSNGINVIIYDRYTTTNGRYKEGIISLLEMPIVYICVPTPSSEAGIILKEVDNVFELLALNSYSGQIVLKSTVMPGTTQNYINMFPTLSISFCPEFLSAKTNIFDYANQKNIILGIISKKNVVLESWYSSALYSHAELSIVSIIEAESVKIFCNVFYAVKIQTFTEFYLTCQNNGADFDKVRDLMLKNNWINPMHTIVPNNGKISFSGMCFPKDISSFNKYLEDKGIDNAIIAAALNESLKHNRVYLDEGQSDLKNLSRSA